MPCTITFSLLTESLAGNIGDDWEYTVYAKVYNPGMTGGGSLRVDEHQLAPGSTQACPPGQVVIPAGDCGTGPRVELTLTAVEADFLVDDKGSNVLSVLMECPGPGGPPFVLEPEITARVREAPGFLGGAASLKVKARLVARC
jgi:hypothetical protein